MERAPLDDFILELEELIRGRYYYTIYSHQSNAHNRLFKRKMIQTCLIAAILFTISYEGFVLARMFDPEITLIHREELETKPDRNWNSARLNSNSNGYSEIIDDDDFDPVRDRYSRASTFQYVNEIRAAQRKMEALKGGESQDSDKREVTVTDVYKLSLAGYLYRVVIRLTFTSVIFLLFCFIYELSSIVHDVLIRYIVAARRRSLIAGMLRFRRIV